LKNEKNKEIIEALEEVYGEFKYDSALFGRSNYSKIAADLCYSNSHFSKLMSGGATEGMYERALDNVKKLLKLKNLEEKLATPIAKKPTFLVPLLVVTSIMFGSLLLYNTMSSRINPQVVDADVHPLNMYFEFNDSKYYKSPYLSEEQVHEYCPGSAYEGRWELAEKYIIPIPYKIPGLYYVGSSADIRLKCKKSSTNQNLGKEIIGFENIINEIWFDRSMTPIYPTYFDRETNTFNKEFEQLNFESNTNFVKIASVYSCFFDEITITQDSIYRTGEPCGRYANSENDDILSEFNLNLNHIIEYVIGNMTFAQCSPIENMFCDPNDLLNGESELSFQCKCSIKTENLGLGGSYPYTKSIKLREQNYQSNLLCSCN